MIDSMVGRIFAQYPSMTNLVQIPHKPLLPENFKHFRYSRWSHFRQFRVLKVYKGQSPATCDLKVYQDSLVYTYIRDNFPPGARLLEIGGGESRIIAALKDQYELWNLDKLEGEGFGPTNLFSREGYKLVLDYIGKFSKELPDDYFNFVFSISTLEHLPDDNSTIDSVIQDINRVLKPGCYSLHCVDGRLISDRLVIHKIVSILQQRGFSQTNEVCFADLIADKDLWLLPKYTYYARWYYIIRKSIENFGYPLSINILCHKQQ